jgi:hypothetical protein
MNSIDPNSVQRALNVFRKEKIITVAGITRLLGGSDITARRYLKRWKALTSYNCKGMYYTLPHIPEFNANGLWVCCPARFTRYGNMKNTIAHLVYQSPVGMSAEEIGKIVGLDPRSFMHHYRNAPGVRREKRNGRYIYFADDAEIGTKQEQTRRRAESKRESSIAEADAVTVLVEFIKHPEADVQRLCALPALAGKGLSVGAVVDFLERHGLSKKKLRTPGDTMP